MLTEMSSVKSQLSDKKYERYWNSFWRDMPEGFALGKDPAEFVLNAVAELKVSGTRIVLDVGCGDGRNYRLLRQSGFHVVGLDIVHRAVGLLKKNISFDSRSTLSCQGRVQALPFRAETIDTIVASDLFSHLLDWHTALDECWRVLKTGGYLLCNPLSLHDDLYGKGNFVTRNAYFYQERLMRFCSDEDIYASFARTKLHIARCVEGFREDPPHPKFMDTKHRHVFWNVWAQKLGGDT